MRAISKRWTHISLIRSGAVVVHDKLTIRTLITRPTERDAKAADRRVNTGDFGRALLSVVEVVLASGGSYGKIDGYVASLTRVSVIVLFKQQVGAVLLVLPGAGSSKLPRQRDAASAGTVALTT